MRCPIRRASARLAQSQISGEDGNAPSQPVEQPHALAEVAHDEVMTALSDDQVRIMHCSSWFFFQWTTFQQAKLLGGLTLYYYF